MPIKHAIWTVGDKPTPLPITRLATEQVLEDMIENGSVHSLGAMDVDRATRAHTDRRMYLDTTPKRDIKKIPQFFWKCTK